MKEIKNAKISTDLSIVNAPPVSFKITMMFPIMHQHAWTMTNAVMENMNVAQTALVRIHLVHMLVNVILDFLVTVSNVSILTNVLETVTNATLLPIASTPR